MSDDTSVLPRSQRGAQPQRLLTTLFGDYWLGRAEPLPSAALVQLLAEFDVSASSARAAIQRLAARRFLVGERHGRETRYGVPPKSDEVLTRHIRRVFGTIDPEPWDGAWTIVGFSVPEHDRATRRRLRESLRAQHFGRLYDGLWISPWHPGPELAQLVDATGPANLTVFRGQHLPTGVRRDLVTEAFDLDELASRYRAFVELCTRTRAEVDGPGQALRVRTEVMAAWRRVKATDPRLPAELLPPEWPGSSAQDACAEVYDALGPAAQERFRGVLAEHAPDLAGMVTHHTFRERQRMQP